MQAHYNQFLRHGKQSTACFCCWQGLGGAAALQACVCQEVFVCTTGLQEHWRSLKTDQFLQVQGTGGSILALGDAATVSQVPTSACAACCDLPTPQKAIVLCPCIKGCIAFLGVQT